MKIKFLKANNGDSILISLEYQGKMRNILIDGGIGETYVFRNRRRRLEDGVLKKAIKELQDKGEIIDLLILTHVDDDHIGGILKWFEKDPLAHKLIGKTWFNSGKLIAEHFNENDIEDSKIELYIRANWQTGIGQGINFENYLKEHKIWDRKIIRSGLTKKMFGLEFQIISPNEKKMFGLLKKWDRERPDYREYKTAAKHDYGISLKEHIKNDKFRQDSAVQNGSSIAFVMKYGQKKWLFLADAHPSVVIEWLKKEGHSISNPLEVELVKLSHHGSKGNNSIRMLQMIKSDNYVVCTDGSRHGHPNKRMLSRLIKVHPNCTIYFNYSQRKDAIFSAQDRKDFKNFKVKGITKEFEY